VFGGVTALVTVVVIGSHGCCERIVTVNVCRFVPGTGSNVHIVGPALVGSRSTVIMPVQVPARNDDGADGVVGAGEPRSQRHVELDQSRTVQLFLTRF
jgi:hypothetical protein